LILLTTFKELAVVSDIYKAIINSGEQAMKDPNRVADLVEWYAPIMKRIFYGRVAGVPRSHKSTPRPVHTLMISK
jgi:hypothetical protein